MILVSLAEVRKGVIDRLPANPWIIHSFNLDNEADYQEFITGLEKAAETKLSLNDW